MFIYFLYFLLFLNCFSCIILDKHGFPLIAFSIGGHDNQAREGREGRECERQGKQLLDSKRDSQQVSPRAHEPPGERRRNYCTSSGIGVFLLLLGRKRLVEGVVRGKEVSKRGTDSQEQTGKFTADFCCLRGSFFSVCVAFCFQFCLPGGLMESMMYSIFFFAWLIWEDSNSFGWVLEGYGGIGEGNERKGRVYLGNKFSVCLSVVKWKE